MLFRIILVLSLLFIATLQYAQVPEVEHVSAPREDPFMPSDYFRPKLSNKLTYALKTEKKLSADFTGQFISLIRSNERLLIHPVFSQFGKLSILIENDVIHYGITTNYNDMEKFDDFLQGIVKPKIVNYDVRYYKNGKKLRSWMRWL